MSERLSLPKRALAAVASLRLTVIGLTVLLVLTIWGTLYQTDHGLFQAQQRFYQSWFFLAGGFLPLPGAQLAMAVLFVNLVAAGIWLTIRQRMSWGVFLTHSGLLMMIAAGGVTFYLGQEAHLTLLEGDAANVAETYHTWELAVWPETTGDAKDISAIDVDGLKSGMTIPYPSGAFEIQVEDFYPNTMASGGSPGDGAVPYLNGSGVTQLQAAAPDRDPEHNAPGLTMVLRQGGQEMAHVLLWGGDRAPTHVTLDGTAYTFSLRRRHIPLPATIRLDDFRREMHPGSDIAKSYSSRVSVNPGQAGGRSVVISMNKPLRLQNFTFYQASFNILSGGQEVSTFAVVRNYARTLPYVATGVTVLGMILHFIGRLVMRIRRVGRAGAAA